MPRKAIIPKEKLEDLYLRKGLSCNQIARMFNCTYSCVTLSLRRYGIPRRPPHRWYEAPLIDFSKLSDGVIGYIAGLIDGDGSIQIQQTKAGRPQVRIAIYNKDKNLIKWLVRTLKATYGRHAESGFTKCRDVYVVRLARTFDVYELLRRCLPYMIVKRSIAEKAVEMLQELIAEVKKENAFIKQCSAYKLINEDFVHIS